MYEKVLMKRVDTLYWNVKNLLARGEEDQEFSRSRRIVMNLKEEMKRRRWHYTTVRRKGRRCG